LPKDLSICLATNFKLYSHGGIKKGIDSGAQENETGRGKVQTCFQPSALFLHLRGGFAPQPSVTGGK